MLTTTPTTPPADRTALADLIDAAAHGLTALSNDLRSGAFADDPQAWAAVVAVLTGRGDLAAAHRVAARWWWAADLTAEADQTPAATAA